MKPHSFAFPSRLRRLRHWTIALTLTSITVVASAHADPSADVQKSAQLRYREAIDAYRQAKWDESRRLLLGLWQQSHTYDVAYALGQAEYQLGHYAAAANYLEFALSNIPPTEKLSAADEERKSLTDLQGKTARLKITTDQPSADILVDGLSVGSAPLAAEVYVDPGPHVIEAKLDQRKATQSIDASRGTIAKIDLKLGAAVAAPRFDPSTSQMPAVTSAQHDASKHTIEARTVALWAGVGVTAISLGAGIGFAFKGSSASSDAEGSQSKLAPGACFGSAASSTSCSTLSHSLDERNSANSAETISFAIAGVAAAATTAMFFIWPTREERTASRVHLVPIATLNTGGLTINGNF
jgi:hypothetical protein